MSTTGSATSGSPISTSCTLFDLTRNFSNSPMEAFTAPSISSAAVRSLRLSSVAPSNSTTFSSAASRAAVAEISAWVAASSAATASAWLFSKPTSTVNPASTSATASRAAPSCSSSPPTRALSQSTAAPAAACSNCDIAAAGFCRTAGRVLRSDPSNPSAFFRKACTRWTCFFTCFSSTVPVMSSERVVCVPTTELRTFTTASTSACFSPRATSASASASRCTLSALKHSALAVALTFRWSAAPACASCAATTAAASWARSESMVASDWFTVVRAVAACCSWSWRCWATHAIT
mmetsp:Transcript_49215/g.111505  ORF Transcript_49215/g.111505 Transcript_49215/m.111505 type:complete len:293 (-) Transcript_49215:251-1129(-)